MLVLMRRLSFPIIYYNEMSIGMPTQSHPRPADSASTIRAPDDDYAPGTSRSAARLPLLAVASIRLPHLMIQRATHLTGLPKKHMPIRRDDDGAPPMDSQLFPAAGGLARELIAVIIGRCLLAISTPRAMGRRRGRSYVTG